jgi:hypothetical protein
MIAGLFEDGHSLRSISPGSRRVLGTWCLEILVLESPVLGATQDLDSAINIHSSVLKWNLAFMEALTRKFFSEVNMKGSALKCATRERVGCTWRCSPLLFKGLLSMESEKLFTRSCSSFS